MSPFDREALCAQQFVTADEVASLFVYLRSDAAAQIKGANYSIDGGWTAPEFVAGLA